MVSLIKRISTLAAKKKIFSVKHFEKYLLINKYKPLLNTAEMWNPRSGVLSQFQDVFASYL